MSAVVDRGRLADLIARERAAFAGRHPRSRELFASTSETLLEGVPMSWMALWEGGFPIFFEEARGSTLTDVDGNVYADFCLGDTGAMAGHAPEATAAAVTERYRRGSTAMLPTADAAWVGQELVRRFGLEVWQFALSATDANRWMLRVARHLTGRPKVLVFNGCYHGTVDEANVVLDERGVPRSRHGNLGPAVEPASTTKVIEFNDVEALERALAPRDVAAVLAEPVLSNIGIVPAEPGYHDALRRIARETGTCLIIDETHTMACGPGGYTRAHGLEPDMLTVGKSLAGGIPIGAYGMRRELADELVASTTSEALGDNGSMGSTLGGNALALAAARATLEHVLTEEAFSRTIPLAERLAGGVTGAIAARRLPWHILQLGARAEYRFGARVPRTGGESAAMDDPELNAYMRIYLMNRGVLVTPFQNMALIAPTTTAADVDRFVQVFADAADELLAGD